MSDVALYDLLLPFSWNLFSGLCPKRIESPVCIIPIFNVNTWKIHLDTLTDQFLLPHHNSVFLRPLPLSRFFFLYCVFLHL